MNLLFCGDRTIEDGLIIAIISLVKAVKEPINVTVLTMQISTAEKEFLPLPARTTDYLDHYVKQKYPESSVTLLDITEQFQRELPGPNLNTRFTPYCMLRLFVDELEGMPDRLLYLDTDVVCRQDISDFYYQDMEGYEVAGVKDRYGKWFFRTHFYRMDYLNSGVLLLNLTRIKETGLFKKCRSLCQTEEMFMPDQSAINKLAERKKFCDRKYNEQGKMRPDTVIQHFSTRFLFFPWPRTQTVKPWEIGRVHREFHLFAYDDILNEYKTMKAEIEGISNDIRR